MQSLLFVPGDSPHKFAKALRTRADALILDLEDSVALGAKNQARKTVAAMLSQDRAGKILIVRINSLDSGLALDDLAATMPGSPDMIMLPKCRGGADVQLLGHYLAAFEAVSGLHQGCTGVVPIATETGEAVLGLGTYRPDPRLRGLMWGAEDLAASLGATDNRDGSAFSAPFKLARNLCLMAASQAGVPAIDTICTDISNLDSAFAEAEAARRDGFGAKAVIHPAHVDAVNTAFRPSDAEIVWAKTVVAAFEGSPGSGVVQIDGKMIDNPHERMAHRILAVVRPEDEMRVPRGATAVPDA
ncbi:HpcH/HpaI aldolase/citrate lyase family protein [Agrobacterium pusense]|uniref:HpcH/HpaI aldolase/citrate lyase family protein n=1 Tax=Agrobacterium pusense TaxID=648995 RepID=UPI003FD66182